MKMPYNVQVFEGPNYPAAKEMLNGNLHLTTDPNELYVPTSTPEMFVLKALCRGNRATIQNLNDYDNSTASAIGVFNGEVGVLHNAPQLTHILQENLKGSKGVITLSENGWDRLKRGTYFFNSIKESPEGLEAEFRWIKMDTFPVEEVGMLLQGLRVKDVPENKFYQSLGGSEYILRECFKGYNPDAVVMPIKLPQENDVPVIRPVVLGTAPTLEVYTASLYKGARLIGLHADLSKEMSEIEQDELETKLVEALDNSRLTVGSGGVFRTLVLESLQKGDGGTLLEDYLSAIVNPGSVNANYVSLPSSQTAKILTHTPTNKGAFLSKVW